MRLRTCVLAILLLAASLVTAQPAQTVLTEDGTLVTLGASGTSLAVTRISNDDRQVLALPDTTPDSIDTEASLLWDRCSDAVFVVWHREELGLRSLRLASLDGTGEWRTSFVIAESVEAQAGVQILLTHGRQGGQEATLLHAAWWELGEQVTPRYALVAFENGLHVSTEMARLDDLAGVPPVGVESEVEDTGAAIHPPLALARHGNSVDIAYGAVNSTDITRLSIDPRRTGGEARIWRPVGRAGGRTGPARLTANSAAPVQSFLTRGRIVLFTPGVQFRFIVHENGAWMPIRTIDLDGSVTTEQVTEELRRSLEEHSEASSAPAGEPES
jgi:hypothetical protein